MLKSNFFRFCKTWKIIKAEQAQRANQDSNTLIEEKDLDTSKKSEESAASDVEKNIDERPTKD